MLTSDRHRFRHRVVQHTVALVARIAHRFQAFRQRERVAVVAAHRCAVTPGGGIPRRLGPLDPGPVAHAEVASEDAVSMAGGICPVADSTLSGTTTAASPPIFSRLTTCCTKLSCLLRVDDQKSSRS